MSWQCETLRFIDDFSKRNGYPPSVRDMVEGLGLKNPSSVQHRLSVLRDEGLVGWLDHAARTVHLTNEGMARVEEA